MGFDISNIKTEKKENVEEVSFLKKEIHLFSSKFSDKVKETFYTELSVLLASGVNLVKALELLAKDQKKKVDQQVVENLIVGLMEGKSLSNTMHLNSKVFTTYEVISFQIGEESGTLLKIAEKLGVFYKKRNQQKKNVINALTYPIVVLCTAVLSVFFMLKFVVPMFADIFKQNQVELPWITKKIILLSHFIENDSLKILLTIAGGFVIYKLAVKRWQLKRYEHQVLLKIPFVGDFFKKLYLSQYTQAITLLTNARVSMLKSIQLTKKMIAFYPLKEALSSVEKKILSGGKLSTAMEGQKIFDKRMIALIKVAEETNNNAYVFERLTEQYMSELEQTSKNLSTLLEPLIIIVLGAIVATILVAMYLPMFKLSTVLG